MNGKITWTELISQPDAWKQLIGRLDAQDGMPSIAIDDFDEIVLLGSGTSYYLALAAADWIGRRHGLDVRALPSCEIILDERLSVLAPGRKRLAIAISRSGESSELIMAIKTLRAAGSTVLGISCRADSTLIQQADLPWLITEGHEDGLVMLRSFTSMLIALQYLFGSDEDRVTLRQLPAAGRALLDNHTDALRAIAHSRPFNRFVYLASGPCYPIALEASLKVQEMSMSTSEAYHSLEYRHGPKATADRNTLLTLFALPDADLGLSLAHDMKALDVSLLVVGSGAEAYKGVADLAIPAFATLDRRLSNIISLLPLQIVAYETAMRRGKNPDAPENLSKVVILETVDG